MAKEQAHFVDLPTEREFVWEKMTHFLELWRNPPQPAYGIPPEALAKDEDRIGCHFPIGLREFYSRFGALVPLGFFNDRENKLLPIKDCYLISEFMTELESPTLVIAEELWGALWGIRQDDLGNPDPQIRCLDSSGGETDGLFSLTEFLIGMLFRTTVLNAPVRFSFELFLDQTESFSFQVYAELREHYSTWSRNNMEEDCGFLAHIEDKEVIASLSGTVLDVGLKNASTLEALPEQLKGLLASSQPKNA